MFLTEREGRAPGYSWPRYLLGWLVPQAFVRVVFRLLYRMRSSGSEHIPLAGPIIYVANHVSNLDPPVAGAVMPRPCHYLARESLFHFRPFGAMIAFFGAIPLRRSGGAAGALRSAIEQLDARRCVLIFPEGTRTEDGEPGRFKGGALLLARRTGAAIVPMAIVGTYEVWPRARSIPRLLGRIRVGVGAPFDLDQLPGDDEAILAHMRERIMELYRVEQAAIDRSR